VKFVGCKKNCDTTAPDVREKIMTIAEQLKAEGMEQEKVIITKRLLSVGAEIDFVAKITELPLEKIKEINQKSH
jgi:hypothetical protein